MILGKIFGKVSTTRFQFKVTSTQAKKFQFIQVQHQDYEFVLCQIVELFRDQEGMIAKCIVIGYKDQEGKIKSIRTPFHLETEVLEAEDEFIKKIIELESNCAFIGYLEGKKIPVSIDLQKILTKHISILAKSGAGKSYTVGVLIEEIIERGIPLLIIDPHGEYSSLKYPSDESPEELAKYGIQAKGYGSKIVEYGDMNFDHNLKPLRLNEKMQSYELMKLFPIQLSSTQESILFSVIKDLEIINFNNILIELENINVQNKWSLIDTVRYLKDLKLFSSNPTPLNELISPNKASIINLKGVEPKIQGMIVSKLLKDLFMARKQNKIPPFFCVIEEAHNFVPEKGFGKAKSSEIIRTIASEGRKFGLGLCVVSQRPALVQKTVLAQCSSQIIMKITNPNDLRVVANSVEGISSETVDEVQNLAVGSALVCGIVDRPLIVNIRKRRTKHGGEAINVLNVKDNDVNGEKERDLKDKSISNKEINFFQEKNKFEKILPIIKPKFNIKEIFLSSEQSIENITTYLIPALLFTCEMFSTPGEKFKILVDKVIGKIVIDPDNDQKVDLEKIDPDYSFLREIVYEEIKYDEIIKTNISDEELISKVKKYCKITDYNQCNIVFHDVDYKNNV